MANTTPEEKCVGLYPESEAAEFVSNNHVATFSSSHGWFFLLPFGCDAYLMDVFQHK